MSTKSRFDVPETADAVLRVLQSKLEHVRSQPGSPQNDLHIQQLTDAIRELNAGMQLAEEVIRKLFGF